MTFVSAHGATISHGSPCWKISSLAKGEQRQFKVDVRAAMVSGPRSLTNTATASASGVHELKAHASVKLVGASSASAPTPRAAPTHKPAPHDAKLTITKTVNHELARFGSTLKYTITVTNAGPATVKTPTVTDMFSTAATIVSVPSPPAAPALAATRLPASSRRSRPRGHATIIVTARPRDLGTIHNSASVTTPTRLAPGSHTKARATTDITVGANSQIALTDRTSTPKIPPGGTARFLLNVTNPNPWPLHNVTVCDRLPQGTMFVSASQGSKRSGRLVCWTLGTLAPHASKSLSVRAEALLGVTGTLSDAATANATAGSHHPTAQAHTEVLVAPTGRCGSISSPALQNSNDPLAVAAC